MTQKQYLYVRDKANVMCRKQIHAKLMMAWRIALTSTSDIVYVAEDELLTLQLQDGNIDETRDKNDKSDTIYDPETIFICSG